MTDLVSLEARKNLLQKHTVFAALTDQENTELASLLIEKKFTPGTTVVKEGDIVDSVYFIIEGKADVRHITLQDGIQKVRSLALLNPGQTIGLSESGFYSITGKRTATVVAITAMLTLQLSVARLHGFALANHHVSEIMRQGAKRALNSQS